MSKIKNAGLPNEFLELLFAAFYKTNYMSFDPGRLLFILEHFSKDPTYSLLFNDLGEIRTINLDKFLNDNKYGFKLVEYDAPVISIVIDDEDVKEIFSKDEAKTSLMLNLAKEYDELENLALESEGLIQIFDDFPDGDYPLFFCSQFLEGEKETELYTDGDIDVIEDTEKDGVRTRVLSVDDATYSIIVTKVDGEICYMGIRVTLVNPNYLSEKCKEIVNGTRTQYKTLTKSSPNVYKNYVN